MISDDECAQWLENEDAISRPSRLPRLVFVADEYGPPRHLLIPGGIIPSRCFEEARWCYVNGQHIGCVLLCQSMVEHMLAALFRLMGEDRIAKSGFRSICIEAEKERLITPEELELFERLRRKRNPYSHHRPPGSKDGVMRRSLTEELDFYDLLEADAQLAIEAVFGLLKRRPFAFYIEDEDLTESDTTDPASG